jgi:uridine phosphorylase
MREGMNSNFPIDLEGRTYHVSVKPGDVANRILTVGDLARATRIASLLDKEGLIKVESTRGFLTYTGLYKTER